MALKLEVSIFNIVAAVAAVSAIILKTATTLDSANSVLAQGPAKSGFHLYE